MDEWMNECFNNFYLAPYPPRALQALDAARLRNLLKGMMGGVATTEKIFLQVDCVKDRSNHGLCAADCIRNRFNIACWQCQPERTPQAHFARAKPSLVMFDMCSVFPEPRTLCLMGLLPKLLAPGMGKRPNAANQDLSMQALMIQYKL
eukprot:1160959-Pelagomonas_calceolata.AAC.6